MLRLILTVFVLFIYFGSIAQGSGDLLLKDEKDLIISYYTVNDGLASNSIRKIQKGQNGLLFLATYNGISAFDGKIFHNYNTSNISTILSNNIYDFCVDAKNRLWFGTHNGILIFDGISFSTTNALKATQSFDVQSLIFDNKGVLWIGTTSNGLYTYQNDKLEKIGNLKDIDKNIISLLFADKNNNIWIGTEQGHLYMFDGNNFVNILNTGQTNGIYAACQDNQGNVFFGSRKGLFVYRNKQIILLSDKVSSINDLALDKEGRLWLATNSGLYYYLKEKNEVYSLTHSNFHTNQIVQSIYFDPDGIVWIGTYRKGLIKLRNGHFENFSFSEIGIDDVPSDVVELDDKTLLISTDEGEIYQLKNKKLSKLNLKSLLNGNKVKTLFIDSEHNVWVCSYNGLYKITPTNNHIALSLNELSDNTIRNIIETEDGYFWIGTRQSGIHKMTKDLHIIKSIDTKSNLSSNFVMSMVKGKKEKIFVATKNGFDIVYKDSVIGHFDKKNGLSDNMVFNIYEDDDKILWIATLSGLSRLELGKFTNFNKKNGLVETPVYDVLEDDYGYLWLPANNGIIRVKKSDLNLYAAGKKDKITSILLDEADGMNNEQYVSASKLLKTSKGKIVVNTLSGVSILNPSARNFERTDPSLIIKSITTETKEYLINADITKLAAYTRYVQIDFSYIDFFNQEKASFNYMLEPFDSDWQKSGNNRFAKYTNLPPGDYTFHLKAIINSKGGTIIDKSIRFTIEPAFFETVFFKFIIVFVILVLIWFVYIIRVKTIKNQKAHLENLVQERTTEINTQKEAIEEHINELENQKAEIARKNEEIMIAGNRIEQAYLNLKLLSDLGQQVTSYLVEDEMLTALYQEINSQMDCDLISIGHYNKESKLVNFNSTIFKGKKIKEVEGTVNDSKSILNLSLLDNVDIITNNIQNDYPEYSRTFPELNTFKSITSLISIPLRSHNETIGVFTVQSFRKESYSEYHFNLMKNLAVYIGIAIENTKTFKELKAQKDELVKVNASKDRMFSIIGHDLRGPVGTIKSFLDIIIDNPEMASAEETLDILKTMQQSLGSAYNLLDNLLLWARSQRGLVEFEPRLFSIKNPIDEILSLVSESARNKEINIKSEANTNDIVYADQNMITTVLRNLISNAIKFTA